MRKIGKYGRKWLNTRRLWFKENPANFYVCYYCGKVMPQNETTLDHKKSRSRHPELRFELSNLVPSCYWCNYKKGSNDS